MDQQCSFFNSRVYFVFALLKDLGQELFERFVG